MRYRIINPPNLTGIADLFQSIFLELESLLDWQIGETGLINFILIDKNNSYLSLEEAIEGITILERNLSNFPLLIGYEEETGHIKSIHETYFSRTPYNEFYCLDMENLYFGSNVNNVDKEKLINSITYGIFKEIAAHNADHEKVLPLLNYLALNPLQTSYRIIKKESIYIERERGNRKDITLSFFPSPGKNWY